MLEHESFADVPVSLGEVRSERASDSSLISPRDAVISVLRDIDKGELKPEVLIVCFSYQHEDGSYRTGYNCSSPNGIMTLGVLHNIASRYAE